jgi:sporulation protein YlmC with PRC-barrel domain
MEPATHYTIGAPVADTDGPVGEVTRIVVDPVERRVTHLVVEPKHRFGLGRLVPLDMVEASGDEIRLLCDTHTFDALDSAEDVLFVRAADDWRGEGLVDAEVGDSLPSGEVALKPGQPVHAVDGEIGEVEGFVAEGSGHQVTHLLLREGHFLRRKEVAIPVDAVTGVDDGIRLNLTKHQIEELPPLRDQDP